MYLYCSMNIEQDISEMARVGCADNQICKRSLGL